MQVYRSLLIWSTGCLACILCIGQFHSSFAEPRGTTARNAVYVKIVIPAKLLLGADDTATVESWISNQFNDHDPAGWIAATEWVALSNSEDETTRVWDGECRGERLGCPVNAEVARKEDDRVQILVTGWGAAPIRTRISVVDEPGSRRIEVVEGAMPDMSAAYVAVLVGPPSACCR